MPSQDRIDALSARRAELQKQISQKLEQLEALTASPPSDMNEALDRASQAIALQDELEAVLNECIEIMLELKNNLTHH